LRGLLSKTPGALTPRRVPEAYVRAEVASYPLTSFKSFTEVVTELSPDLDAHQDNGRRTAELWRDCEKSLSEHASGWSLDRLLAIRDFFWFECSRVHPAVDPYAAVPMHSYLRRLANEYLERRAGITEMREWRTNVSEAMMHYRWLTFALPEDLLMAATNVKPAPTRVEVDPPILMRRLLDRGVAEIHQHANGGIDFPTLWVSALAALADPRLKPDALDSPGLVFNDSETTLRWLLAAAAARSVLAEFLISGDDSLCDYVRKARPGWGEGRGERWGERRWRILERVLTALDSGDRRALPDFYVLRGLYQEIHPEGYRIAMEGPPESADEIWKRCDPIGARLSLDSRSPGESWFVENGLARLESWGQAGEAKRRQENAAAFERIFWQIIRVRCLLYRTVVQRPMTAGLQWFIRFFGRLHPLRQPLRHARAELSYRIAGGQENRSIAALELRITPRESSFELAREIQGLTLSWRRVLEQVSVTSGGSAPELGVILHLVKERDPKRQWASGMPPAGGRGTHAEPHMPGSVRLGGRYATYFSAQSRRVQAVGDLLEKVPASLWVLRGLDVASDELSVPTWVMVPFYQSLEQRSASAATKCRFAPARRPSPLRLTAHVGEDFRHLMEGLRRIFECVQYLLREPGGRLGHATALGVEPRLWAEETGRVMMPKEERLWDLVFEWRLYTRFRLPDELHAIAPPGRIEWVETQIAELAIELFPWLRERVIGASVVAMAHDELHTLWSASNGPHWEIPLGLDAFNRRVDELPSRLKGEPALELLKYYLQDEETYRRGQKLIDISVDEPEISALYAVQDALRRCIGARSIVVEINPSSNLLIGNLLDLRNHPTLRLSPPEPEEGSPPAVPVALGSDDPITFSTNCLREYSLLFGAALSAGYSERTVIRWLEEIQRTSMDARFTLAWRPSAQKMASWLVDEFDRYLQTSSAAIERRRRRGPRSQTGLGRLSPGETAPGPSKAATRSE
jgi:hypothetical protein